MSYAATADHFMTTIPTGWRRWVLSTNHKDIGTMYIIFGAFGAFFGSTLSLLIRFSWPIPMGPFLSGDEFQIYNVVITAHGLVDDFLLCDACSDWWFWQLVCPLNDWGTRHGFPTSE